MSTSPREYHTRLVSGAVSSQQAVSAGHCYSLISNGLHMADMAGKVLVNAMGMPVAGPSTFASYLATADVTTVGYWKKCIALGPFPLTVGADGLPYPIRVRLAGSGDGKGGASVQFRVVVCAPGTGSSWAANAVTFENCMTTAAVGNTPAWLTGDKDLIQLTRTSMISPCWTQVPVIDEIGGSINTQSVCLASIEVWGTTLAGGSDLWVHGLHAQEHCGLGL